MATDSGPSGASTSGLTEVQLASLMSAMRQGIKDEMVTLKRELSAEREAADEKLVKKIKLDKAPTFKKKGHERQYRHNEEVRLKLSDTRAALDEHPPAVEKAKTLLEEGEGLILERQKHIKIADRSENGWATVDEYVEDELADNSDDEKRLSRADARATRKLKAAAQKQGRGFRKPGPRRPFNSSLYSPRPGASFYPLNGPGLLGQAAHVVAGGGYQVPAAAQLGQAKPGGLTFTGLGPCFECGVPGHLRKYCPKVLAGRASGATLNK